MKSHRPGRTAVRPLLPSLLCLVLLAGCASTTTTSTTTAASATLTGKATTASFEADVAGALPAGWTPTGGSWKVAVHDGAPSGTRVLEGHGDATEGRTSLLSDAAGTFADLSARVRFSLVSGEHPQGAGLSFRFVDETHYYCIRYSSSEQGWHLFVANGGDPSKKPEASVAFNGTLPGFGDWVDLRVEAHGPRITATANGTKVIDYTEADPTAPRAGMVGPMLRGQTVALFDDFHVE